MKTINIKSTTANFISTARNITAKFGKNIFGWNTVFFKFFSSSEASLWSSTKGKTKGSEARRCTLNFPAKNPNLLDIKPVVVYDNADVDKTRILADNRKKIGVYRWINKINGNTYIGSSVSISVRMYTYYSLRSLVKSNRPIDRAPASQ